MNFNELGLSAELLRAVSDQGYDTPTPVQAKAIPVILEGGDLMAAAQTGTGKTAGFTLPLLKRLSEGRRPPGGAPRALILAPTRELAAQVQESVRTYGRHLPLRSMTIFGGVGMAPQIKALNRGVDIVVATPGRLLDHCNRRTVDLSRVEVLVLDEADRMLDMGFINDIRKILSLLPAKRQNLLFSATFSEDIRRLAGGLLNSPAVVEMAPRNTTAENISQVVHPVNKADKRPALSYLIGSNNWQQVLVFARTKHGADRLARQLVADGLTAQAIHGNKSQHQRTRTLAQFKQNRLRVLVATDIAARGLDISELPHVVNYDLPNVPEDYVHRIGRTGRAGRGGTALSLVSADEMKLLRDIERLLKRDIERVTVPGFEPDPREMLKPAAGPQNRRRGSGRPGAGSHRTRPGGQGQPRGRRENRRRG